MKLEAGEVYLCSRAPHETCSLKTSLAAGVAGILNKFPRQPCMTTYMSEVGETGLPALITIVII